MFILLCIVPPQGQWNYSKVLTTPVWPNKTVLISWEGCLKRILGRECSAIPDKSAYHQEVKVLLCGGANKRNRGDLVRLNGEHKPWALIVLHQSSLRWAEVYLTKQHQANAAIPILDSLLKGDLQRTSHIWWRYGRIWVYMQPMRWVAERVTWSRLLIRAAARPSQRESSSSQVWW